MILKESDDKREILEVLKKLLNHPKIYPAKKEQVKRELYKIKVGWKNEREAAYYIDSYLKDSDRTVVLHDLRLRVGAYSVQIDHLLLHRTSVVILESKYFSSRLVYDRLNDSFLIRDSKGKLKGIPDPRKQAERQALEFRRIVKFLNLENYLALNVDYFVLVSPETVFSGKMPEGIVKADRIKETLDSRVDRMSLLEGVKRSFSLFKTSKESLIHAGRLLLNYHQPLTVKEILKRLKLDWVKID